MGSIRFCFFLAAGCVLETLTLCLVPEVIRFMMPQNVDGAQVRFVFVLLPGFSLTEEAVLARLGLHDALA